jgi:hypothetical protein
MAPVRGPIRPNPIRFTSPPSPSIRGEAILRRTTFRCHAAFAVHGAFGAPPLAAKRRGDDTKTRRAATFATPGAGAAPALRAGVAGVRRHQRVQSVEVTLERILVCVVSSCRRVVVRREAPKRSVRKTSGCRPKRERQVF